MTRALMILALIGAAAGPAAASHCHEVSPVVGHERCGSFGARWEHRWWMGFYIYEAALVVDRVTLPGFDDTGRVFNTAGSASYRALLAPGARHTLWTAGSRIHVGYRGPRYTLGTELVPTFALDPPTLNTQVDGQPVVHSARASVFDIVGVAGVHTRVTSALDLGTELAVGLRELSLLSSLPGGYTTCPGGATGKNCGFSVSRGWALVEVRLHADVWLRPHTTLGVALGIDASGRGESFAVNLGYHLAAFDGA